MRYVHIVVPLLCAVPVLQSCGSLTTTLAGYGVNAMIEVRHSTLSPEMYYDLGRYYQAQNRWDSAARAFEEALKLRKDYVEAANALAMSYAMQGQYERAIARLEDAIRQAPGEGYLHNNLGYAYYLQSRYPEAVASLDTATRLEPENRRAWRSLGLAYAKAGEPEKALAAQARADASGARAAPPLSRQSLPDAPQRAHPPKGEVASAVPVHRPAPVSTPPVSASSANDVKKAAMDVVPVAPSIYELRPVQTWPVPPAARAAVASADTPAAPTQRPFRVEVSNGNGTTGMARRIAGSLKGLGMNTVRLTNQMPWQAVSEIQFGEGYALEAAKLAGLLGHEVLTVRNDKLRRDINVRLVLGKDVRSEVAFVTPRDAAGSTKIAAVK